MLKEEKTYAITSVKMPKILHRLMLRPLSDEDKNDTSFIRKVSSNSFDVLRGALGDEFLPRTHVIQQKVYILSNIGW